MGTTLQAAMTFALSSNGRVVYIDDVENGAQCGCICPKCGDSLIAKNGGQERAHHFAHDNSTECKGGAETIIHLAAKQIIADYKRVTLPLELGALDIEKNHISVFENVHLEHTLCHQGTNDRIIADCFGIGMMGSLIIEIAVHHRVDNEKAEKVQLLGIPAIEINLNDQIGKIITWDELENAVLFDTNRRQWILSPQAPTYIPGPEEIYIEVTPTPEIGLHEWRFAVGATWIWVTELPFGNVRVFHRFDERARRIVEPICRKRGYWNAKYKNWIVFDHFKSELLQLLTTQAKAI